MHLIAADPTTVCEIDRNNLHAFIVSHPEFQVYNDIVDNGVHAGYSVWQNGLKIGEVYEPFTYHWSALFFAPDGHHYGLMTKEFPGNHPSVQAFKSLFYHHGAWGRHTDYSINDLLWIDSNGHRFIYKVVAVENSVPTHAVHTFANNNVFPVTWNGEVFLRG